MPAPRPALDGDLEADLHKGGTVTVATTAAQEQRLRASVATERAWGVYDG